jgi:hypothetical protein
METNERGRLAGRNISSNLIMNRGWVVVKIPLISGVKRIFYYKNPLDFLSKTD